MWISKLQCSLIYLSYDHKGTTDFLDGLMVIVLVGSDSTPGYAHALERCRAERCLDRFSHVAGCGRPSRHRAGVPVRDVKTEG